MTSTASIAAPAAPALIRWAKLELIQPPPQKHGKIYFVVPWARYGAANDQTAPASPPHAKVKHESATSIIERLIMITYPRLIVGIAGAD